MIRVPWTLYNARFIFPTSIRIRDDLHQTAGMGSGAYATDSGHFGTTGPRRGAV